MVEAKQVLPIGQISKWRLLRDLLSIPDSRMSKTPGSLRLGLWEVPQSSPRPPCSEI